MGGIVSSGGPVYTAYLMARAPVKRYSGEQWPGGATGCLLYMGVEPKTRGDFTPQNGWWKQGKTQYEQMEDFGGFYPYFWVDTHIGDYTVHYIEIIKGSLVANFRYTNFWVAGQE